MTNTDMLKALIDKSGLRMQFIADRLGLSRYGLQLKVENINEFKPSEIVILCDLLGIKSLKQRDKIFFAKKVNDTLT